MQKPRRRTSLPTAPGRDRILFREIGLGVIYQDAAGQIVDANPAAQRILGLTFDELEGRTSFDPRWKAVWPDGTPTTGDQHPAIQALRTGERVGPVEMGVTHPDFGIRWLVVTAIPQKHANEELPCRVSVFFEDITARRVAERALLVSEGRVQRLVEANVIGIMVAENTGVIQANDAFLEMVGYDRTDLQQGVIDWRAMTPVEFHGHVDAAVRAIGETGHSEPFEKEFVRKDGSRVPVLIGAAQLNHSPLRWVSFVVDLQKLKSAQGEVQRQENMLDHAYDAIFAWDWDGGITYWNRGAERLYGFPASEAIGQISHELLRTEHMFSRTEFLNTLEERGFAEGEIVHFHRDGRKLDVESRHQLVHDGERRYVLEVNRDITSRKEIEREREAFVDALAHDLKNPLGAAKAQAQLMIRRTQKGVEFDRDSVVRGLNSVVSSINRMNDLIGEMLDAAQLRDGRGLEIQRDRIDLVDLATNSTTTFNRLTPRHSIIIHASCDRLWGNWDRSRLERVIGNLLDNAIKYSPAGGEVSVDISREQRHGTDWAKLSVRDHGVGIPADELSTVFQRYRRARNVAGRFAGAGIGLSGVKAIVEQHGGSITIESVEGEGTTFTIRLPLD